MELFILFSRPPKPEACSKVVGARNYVRGSFSRWALSMNVGCFDFEPCVLAIELPHDQTH